MASSSAGAGVDLLREGGVVLDYTSLDYESVFQDLETFAQTRFSDRWTNFNESEFAVIWLANLSYLFDLLTFQFNAVLGETNPLTALRRQNFIVGAAPFDFRLSSAVPSTVDITITSDPAELPYLLLAGEFKISTPGGIIFMPVADTLVTQTPQTVGFSEGNLQDNELLGFSDGTSSQEYVLEVRPLIDSTLVVTVDGVVWEERTNRADALSTDEVYFVSVDENDETTIIFGDNVNGKTPPSSAELRATYKAGGGLPGSNANPETITTVTTPVAGVVSVTNFDSASGGRPRQTINEGKTALPASISTNRRAVTVPDYADILFISGDDELSPPGGVAKASALLGPDNRILSFIAPSGGGNPSTTLLSEVSAYYSRVKEAGRVVDLRSPIYIPLELEIDAFIDRNFNQSDVISRLRALLVTEDPAEEVQTGIFDFDNLGFAARDDDDIPQVTITRIQSLFASLRDFGLQKGVIRKLRAKPVLRDPVLRFNSGQGLLTSVITSEPPTEGNTPRREWVVRFTSQFGFEVYQRIVGYSTFIADDRLVDDRLNLEDLGFTASIGSILPTDAVVNPNRFQEVTFALDLTATTGDTLVKTAGSAGTLFGVAAKGDEYYIEFLDGTGSLGSTYTSNASLLGNIEFTLFQLNATTPFTAGDEVLFDVFEYREDVLLRPGEFPLFERNATTGVATDLIINPRTAL